MSDEDLCYSTAAELAARIRSRDLSAREVVAAHLRRIDDINPVINAVVSARDPDAVLAEAAAADQRSPGGALHGLPVVVKDLADVAGLPTSKGSRTTSTEPVTTDSVFVSRLRAAGAIVVGKSNTPEFGAGAQTFNDVFGTTRNPYDPSRTPGGSSGGAAAALAAGMVPLADGTDLGGSLRNPAAFCNVVGLRPAVGRVPRDPDQAGHLDSLSVIGPMGRSVSDVALLLSVMAGPDPGDPLSLAAPSGSYHDLGSDDLPEPTPLRVAWGATLGLPVEAAPLTAAEAAVARLEDLGWQVVEAAPDLSDAMAAFRVLRAVRYRSLAGRVPRDRWDLLKDTVRWNIEQGLALGVDDVLWAEAVRTRLHQQMAEFFTHHDVLAVPAAQLQPFPVEIEWPRTVADVAMQDYIDWMSIYCVITMTGCPAISLPAGFTDGLPTGVQLVGPHRSELALLRAARVCEQLAGPWRRPNPAEVSEASADRVDGSGGADAEDA